MSDLNQSSKEKENTMNRGLKVDNEDVRFVADHLVHSIQTLISRYNSADSFLTFKDYVIANVATDLNHKYSALQIKEAFQDYKLGILLDFYTNHDNSVVN